MKVITDVGKKGVYKINDDIYLLVLPDYFPFISKILYKKYLKRIPNYGNALYYASDNLKKNGKLYEKIRKKTVFADETREEINGIFIYYLEKIIRAVRTEAKMSIYIFSDSEDKRIFSIVKSIKDFTDSVYLVTENEELYDRLSKEIIERYGMTVTMKSFSDSRKGDVIIILDTSFCDFSVFSGYILNLSGRELRGKNILWDIVPLGFGDFHDVEIKKCRFLPENCEKFNLIWKNSEKAVDKFQK